MKKVNLEQAINISPILDVRMLYSGEKADLVHLTLKEGEAIAKHDNPIDVIFFILAGKGKLMLDDEEFIISANDCIPVKSGTQRSMENINEADLKVLVYKMKN
ncbi:MAG: cupin domain-containing protein [Bacteroidales bacterium]